MSIVLGVPVPPDATLTVRLKTWIHPCHSGYVVTESNTLGVGMVPMGQPKEQQWSYGKLDSCNDDGVQFNGELPDFRAMMFSGGDLASLLSGPDGGVKHRLELREGGLTKETRMGGRAKLTMNPIEIQLVRAPNGDSELQLFQQGSLSLKVQRSCPEDEKSSGMELFFNCLGWADNNTYIQFDTVSLKTNINKQDDGAKEPTLKKLKTSEAAAEASRDEADLTFPDYNGILRNDSILRQQVDALIEVKKKQNEDKKGNE
jgi:hypothetical protein